MAKFNWSKSGNYMADPARYQRGDDAEISPARKRRRKRASKKALTAPIPAKAPNSNPNKGRAAVSPEIERCRALDRRNEMRWSDTPEGAKIRAQDEKKRVKKLARRLRKGTNTDVKIKRYRGAVAVPETLTRDENDAKLRRHIVERLSAKSPKNRLTI